MSIFFEITLFAIVLSMVYASLSRRIDSLSSEIARLTLEIFHLKNSNKFQEGPATAKASPPENPQFHQNNSPILNPKSVPESIPELKEIPVSLNIAASIVETHSLLTPILGLGGAPILVAETDDDYTSEQNFQSQSKFKGSNDSDIKEPSFWSVIETQLASNLTGILGTLAVLVGVIFLAAYAAIQVNPFGRFLIICGFSGALYTSFVLLKRKPFWYNLSLWIRSSAGILFLAGCIGSVGFESLKWIDNTSFGILLLTFGLLINLLLGFYSGGQGFASLHVAASLIAIALIPVGSTSFVLASIVGLAGVLMSSQQRYWDRHLILSTLSFSAYTIFCYSNGIQLPEFLGLGVSLIIGVASLLSHYRVNYKDRPSYEPAISHIISWVCLGSNLFIFAHGSPWAPLFLFGASIALHIVSLEIGKKGVFWLFGIDQIIGLTLLILAGSTLSNFGLSSLDVSFVFIFILSLHLFYTGLLPLLSGQSKVNPTPKVFSLLFKTSNAVAFAAFGLFFLTIWETPVREGQNLFMSGLYLSLSFILATVLFPVLEQSAENTNNLKESLGFKIQTGQGELATSFLGLYLAFFAVSFLNLSLTNGSPFWFGALPTLIALSQIYYRNKVKNIVLDIATLVGLAIWFFSDIFWLSISNWTITEQLWHLTSLLSVSVLLTLFSKGRALNIVVSWPGVTMTFITLYFGSALLLRNLGLLLLDSFWIGFSILACVIHDRRETFFSRNEPHGKTGLYIAWGGIAGLTLLGIKLLVFDTFQNTLLFEILPERIGAELGFICLLLFWIQRTKNTKIETLNIGTAYFVEALILFSTRFIQNELPDFLQPVIWSLTALLFLSLAEPGHYLYRLKGYSLTFFFGSLFHIALLSLIKTNYQDSSMNFNWVFSLLALGINGIIGSLLLRNKSNEWMKVGFDFPGIFGILNEFMQKISIKLAPSIIYPMFITVSIFLYGSADHALLSLLWVGQCCLLFIASLVLRVPQFRSVSMIGIGLIFLRIIFYDLQGQDFFIKAVVFISVGAILIFMNSMYSKYKDRYSDLNSVSESKKKIG